MKAEEIAKEIQKCKDNPYYFATTYLKIKALDGELVPFQTICTEEEFNSIVKDYESKLNNRATTFQRRSRKG